MALSRLNLLDFDQALKIFPNEYYSQYANHLKILQFQKLIIAQESSRSHIDFKLTNCRSQRRINNLKPKQQTERPKVSRFDSFYDVIKINKKELTRMTNYKNKLKINFTGTKEKPKTKIIHSEKQHSSLSNSLYLKMKAVQDLQFDKKQKNKQELKVELQKQSICKFVKRYNTAKSLRTKTKGNKLQNPEKQSAKHRQIALNLQHIAMQSLQNSNNTKIQNNQKTISRIQSSSLIGPSIFTYDHICITDTCVNKINKIFVACLCAYSYIANVNMAIKRSHTVMRKAGLSLNQEQKVLKMLKQRMSAKTSCGFRNQNEQRNLIQQTKRVKQQASLIKTLKRFDIALQKKAAKLDLQNI